MVSKEYPKTYVITAFQAAQSEKNAKKYGYDSSKGAPNRPLIAGLEKYCSLNGGQLMLLPMNGLGETEPGDCPENYHPFFQSRKDIYLPENRNIKLNKNCIVANDNVPPQNMDPATSRDRLVQNDQTRIYAHSKQRLKSIASGNSTLPKLLVTTGACSHPNYNTRNHKGDMAKKEHRYGSVVVEVIDDTYFNVRQMPALKNGDFIDLGYVYSGSRHPTKATVEALVLGDYHFGDHLESAIKASDEMMEYFKPKRVFLHDFVNGHSVNPHERKNSITRTIAYEQGRLHIEKELKEAYRELCRIAKNNPHTEFNLVHSNHGFFINRYLESGEHINEPWNNKLANKLYACALDGENPVEVGLKMMGKIPSNVNFLKLKDDYKVWGWQLASHGHKGISGGRGSIRSKEVGFGKSITGHSHAPEIQRNTMVVGTNSKLELPYTEGGQNNWLNANAVLYRGGLAQLIIMIDGKWKMKR